MAADAGIDGFFMSWWGEKSLTSRHMASGFLKAKNLSRIRFALYCECLGLLDKADGKSDGVVDFANPAVLEAMIGHFKHLESEYFGRKEYLRIDDKAVVGLYVTRTFRNFDAGKLTALRAAIDTPMYLIADEAFFGRQAKLASSHNAQAPFDAWSAYNMFENAKVRPGETALSYQSREAFPIFRNWAAESTFIPAVFPSYSDFRGHHPLPGTAADFATLLDAAAGIGSADMILVTSFNEWWEGTTIEPAKEYGNSYLDVIRAFTAK